MSEEIQYNITAYKEIGEKYRTAVGAQKFVWLMFHGTHLAYLTGILLVLQDIEEKKQLLPLIFIILFGVFAAAACAIQLTYGHRLIRKILAAGIELEWKVPGLGSLYRNSIHKNFRHKLWKCPKPEDKFNWEPDYLKKLGVRNAGSLLCYFYIAIYIVGGLIIYCLS